MLALAALYYGVAQLGYAFDFAGPVAAIVWLPVGVGVAFLYLGGLRYWPGVVIGDLLVNDYSALPLGSALGQSFGNLLEVLAATLVLTSLSPRGSPLASVSGLASVILAIVVGAAISATVGTLSLRAGGVIDWSSLGHVWRTWLLGDFSGALVVLPLALAWSHPPPGPWPRRRMLEAVLSAAAVVVLAEVALHTSRPFAYLAFPALIWAALRFGQHGATVAVTTTAGFTIWASTHYYGPFAYESLNRSVLTTQLFIAVAALSALAVAALVSEREELMSRVRASRARLLHTADVERERLERNLHDGAQQRLVALAAQLGRAADQIRPTSAETVVVLERAADEVERAIEELRELAHGIHPTALRHFGLARAVQAVVARSPAPIGVVDLPSVRLDDKAEAAAYYLVLEAISNAQKHAGPSTIRIGGSMRNGALHITVVDDGAGGAREASGFGLQSVRDRVEATGGTFGVKSPQGRGTCLHASIPARVLD